MFMFLKILVGLDSPDKFIAVFDDERFSTQLLRVGDPNAIAVVLKC